MALSRLKDWNDGDILYQADLEAEFDNLYNNGLSLVNPLTAALDFNGFALQNLAAGSVTSPGLSFTGDANTGLYRSAADTLDLTAGGVRAARFNTATTGVNFLDVTPSATLAAISLAAAGTDTNIGIEVVPKGTGALVGPVGAVATPGFAFTGDLDTGLWHSAANTVDVAAGGVRAAQFSTVASAVNYLDVAPSATGNAVTATAEGTDTNVSVNLVPKGTGTVQANGKGILNVLDVATTMVEVVNSVVSTTLYTFTVPGGTLGTNRGLRLTLLCDYLNNSGAGEAWAALQMRYGGTIFGGGSGSGTLASDADRRSIRVAWELRATGATNSQVGFSAVSISDASFGVTVWQPATVRTAINSASAVDSTVNQTLDVIFQHTTAAATISFRMFSAQLEWLP